MTSRWQHAREQNDAAVAEWAERGYGALSLEAVAKRAGVGKAALYRRWPSKFALVGDSVETVGLNMARDRDTGSLRGDIRAVLGDLRRTLRHPLVRRILPDLHAEMQRTPELATAIRGRLQKERRAVGTAIVARAMQRGEIFGAVDVDIFNDAVAAILYWRIIVTGQRVSSRNLDDLTDFIAAGLRCQGSCDGLARGRTKGAHIVPTELDGTFVAGIMGIDPIAAK